MPKICNECQKIQREIEKELKEDKPKEKDLTWRICEKYGYLRPV